MAGLVITYACMLPALALMAWWNAGHCWPNFMFNFINRNDDAGLSWKTPLIYLVMMVYLLTPPVVWGLLKNMKPFGLSLSKPVPTFLAHPSTPHRKSPWGTGSGRTETLALLAFVPLLLFGLLSLVKTIGLHWVLSFLPFAFMLLALKLDRAGLAKIGKFFIGFAVLQVGLVIVVSQLPLETWQKTKWYDSAVLTFEGKQIAQQLQSYEKDYVFASDGYADAVTQGFNSGHYFIVFGEASSHARHDDILTDFTKLDHRNILILRKSRPQADEYAEYFHQTSVESFALRGVNFYLVLGRDFNYPLYRDKVLANVERKYYAIPAWLPQTGCYFCQRYFPQGKQKCCRR
jgi:hypothetical protein